MPDERHRGVRPEAADADIDAAVRRLVAADGGEDLRDRVLARLRQLDAIGKPESSPSPRHVDGRLPWLPSWPDSSRVAAAAAMAAVVIGGLAVLFVRPWSDGPRQAPAPLASTPAPVLVIGAGAGPNPPRPGAPEKSESLEPRRIAGMAREGNALEEPSEDAPLASPDRIAWQPDPLQISAAVIQPLLLPGLLEEMDLPPVGPSEVVIEDLSIEPLEVVPLRAPLVSAKGDEVIR